MLGQGSGLVGFRLGGLGLDKTRQGEARQHRAGQHKTKKAKRRQDRCIFSTPTLNPNPIVLGLRVKG